MLCWVAVFVPYFELGVVGLLRVAATVVVVVVMEMARHNQHLF